MRFTSRRTGNRPSDTADEDLQPGDSGLPQKAERLLGARLGRRKTEKKGKQKEETFQQLPNAEQKNLGTLLQAQEAVLDTQQSLLHKMPNHRPGLNVWPNVERESRSAGDLHNAYVYQPTGRPGIPPRKTSSNALHDYYDPSRQPSYVSQQTSASAVRDMGLRKGSPLTMHETSSDPTLVKRPLKSALKKQASEETRSRPETQPRPETPQKLRSNSNEKEAKKPRRLDLAQFFPQPRSHSRNLLSPNHLSRSPSAISDTSEFFPAQTVQVQLRRPAASGRLEPHKTMKPPSVNSDLTTRVKIFEPDIFDHAKTNVRRPPKGIKNWFDGFYISSDDEEPELERKPEFERKPHVQPQVQPQILPQELPATEVPVQWQTPVIEALPSTFSTFSPWIKPASEQPSPLRKGSKDPVEDNLLAIRHAQERMQERMRLASRRKISADSVTSVSHLSTEASIRKRGGESRLAMSELASQSVLSLSDDSSEDDGAGQFITKDSVDDSLAIVGVAARMNLGLPVQPPRRLQTKRSMNREVSSRQSTSTVQTVQTSGSIPIRLTSSVPLPKPTPASPPQADAERDIKTSYSDATEKALRRLNGQESRRTTKASVQDYQETVTSGETSNSMPDAAHMMAVTEEEMALLDMMRRKRAMMQKNSFTEGYQLALTREQEHLARRRVSAQQTALKALKRREEKEQGRSRRSSVQHHPTLEEMQEEYRRKYSAIRKDDVDKALKLQRFLASTDSPTASEFPEPPSKSNSMQMPISTDDRPPQKFELLLPDTYSPTASRMLDTTSPVSAGGSSGPPESVDIDEHHHKVRRFLASSGSESASIFPAPPSARGWSDPKRSTRRSKMSPSPVAEEDFATGIAEWGPRRVSPSQERRGSVIDRQISCQDDSDPLVETASVMPAPLRQARNNQHPYHLAPNFDFSPLEFSASQVTASPSLSTSRASPMTPTFTSERIAVEGASSSDNASVRGRVQTPDTDMTSVSTSGPTTTPASSKRHAAGLRKKPPRLDTILSTGINERGSIASVTSASEDVLAAWAELGGGSEGFASWRRAR